MAPDVSVVNISNVNFNVQWRMGVLVKESKFLIQKISPPMWDFKPGI